ncbi:hypothetical protein A2U01_0106766, partial [Trifolium medium]|nr:hypothetical protein [Trifolium medium]
ELRVQKRTKVNKSQPVNSALCEAQPCCAACMRQKPKPPQQGKHGRKAAQPGTRGCCAQDLPNSTPSAF